jgi:hypothetical protein
MKKSKKNQSNCVKASEPEKKRVKLMEKIEERQNLTDYEMETILREIQVRFYESMDKYELWLLTREMLYLKYALALMRKHNISNLIELTRKGLSDDFAFEFPMGRMYPNGVAVMYDDSYNFTGNARMISDLLINFSPYLNDADQMLFKIAICEENFNPETDEDKLY